LWTKTPSSLFSKLKWRILDRLRAR
jgi:hypothetical protein